MKKFITNITRIVISYGKLLLMIIALSSTGASTKADEAYTYLNCGIEYLRLSGIYIKSNYNIRTKKFLKSYTITQYGEAWIYANKGSYSRIRLNRDTGEMSFSSDGPKYFCKKISFNELPKLDEEGKKF